MLILDLCIFMDKYLCAHCYVTKVLIVNFSTSQ